MKLVAENSPEELARRRALEAVSEVLRELTANLLRVTRGAGKSYEIGKQAQALLILMQNHWDAANMYPSSGELNEALDVFEPVKFSGRDENDAMQDLGERQIIDAVLQMVASQMLGQRTHYSRAHNDFYDGIVIIEKARANRRNEAATAHRAAVLAARPKSKPARRKVAPKPKPRA